MKYRATPDFWYHYRQLPDEIQDLADRCYELLKQDSWFVSGGSSGKQTTGAIASSFKLFAVAGCWLPLGLTRGVVAHYHSQ